MKPTLLLVFLLVLISFTSCNDSEKEQQIVGEWNCTSWIQESTGNNKCNNNVYFKFNKDNSYQSKIGSLQETGVFKIANNLLYSTPENKLEIAVEFQKFSTDTLELIMSRSGNKEVLTLVRK